MDVLNNELSMSQDSDLACLSPESCKVFLTLRGSQPGIDFFEDPEYDNENQPSVENCSKDTHSEEKRDVKDDSLSSSSSELNDESPKE